MIKYRHLKGDDLRTAIAKRIVMAVLPVNIATRRVTICASAPRSGIDMPRLPVKYRHPKGDDLRTAIAKRIVMAVLPVNIAT